MIFLLCWPAISPHKVGIVFAAVVVAPGKTTSVSLVAPPHTPVAATGWANAVGALKSSRIWHISVCKSFII